MALERRTALPGAGATARRALVVPGWWAARRSGLVTRRTLQVALGLLWLLDGALQLQPFMLGPGFAHTVIAPAAAGQPGFVSAGVGWSAALVLGHTALWDVLFAATQLLIGAGLLIRRTARPAIVASLGWAAGVWYLGEGLGGLADGTATFLVGAPGAVVLYAVIGLAAWPRFDAPARHQVMGRSITLRHRTRVLMAMAPDARPAPWVPVAWAGLWGLFALLQALPANDAPGALARQVHANAASAPRWLAHAETVIGQAVRLEGVGPVVALVVVDVVVGVLGLRSGPSRRAGAWAGIVVALGVWVVVQAFGGIFSGTGTDPSSGLLVALLGVALLGVRGGSGEGKGMAARPVHAEASWAGDRSHERPAG